VESVAPSYTSGFAVDPVEKKPLHHFLPGCHVLSFGAIGCNLACDFCQNHHLAMARDASVLKGPITPTEIVAAARRLSCAGVAFTYNEPGIMPEMVLACARACHAAGLVAVLVSNGYSAGAARDEIYAACDAANIDLKSFRDDFYRHHCQGRLAPVLDTLRYIRHHSACWLEITNLLIPGENDSDADIGAMCGWIADELGPDVPLHFSAFHPAHCLRDREPTPPETLFRARDLAQAAGLRYVYCGNIAGRANTCCPNCGTVVVGRRGYEVDGWRLQGCACAVCGTVIPGRWDGVPGVTAGVRTC
jgi:pyruvate formate lyase activating enzyme